MLRVMGISRQRAQAPQNQSKRKPYHKKRKYELGHLLPGPRSARPHTHSAGSGRQEEVRCLEAERGELFLGLQVLQGENKERKPPISKPPINRSAPKPQRRQHTLLTVVRVPLGAVPGP